MTGLWKDLWLDEVWSIQIASGMRSPLDVFTLHHEINHYLNTLWVYWIGLTGTNAQYHLLSFICGITGVLMAVVICRRRGLAAAWIALVLFGFSYEMVAYSTEARGYAAAVLCTLVAFDAFERYNAAPNLLWASIYAAAAILGILSQPIFLAFLASAILVSIYRLFHSRHSKAQSGVSCSTVLLQIIPILAVMMLWWIDMRFVEIGGGTKTQSLISAYGTALAWAVGTSQNPFALTVSVVVAVMLISLALRYLLMDARLFFFGTIVVFPLVLVLARRSAVVYTRHFMIAGVFVLLLLSQLLGMWWSEGRRVICCVLIAGYLAVNISNIRRLSEEGRGKYTAALQEIINRTPAPVVIIGADQDFRVGKEVRYYLSQIQKARQAVYRERGSWPDNGPHWIIVQRESFESPTPPLDHFIDDRQNNYDFVRAYPTAPLSGLHWFIYRNRNIKPD